MENHRKVVLRYEVCLTCGQEKFDSLDDTGYTYGVLIRDNDGKVLYDEGDVHTDVRKAQGFLEGCLAIDTLPELLKDYLDGCDDLATTGTLSNR